MNKIKLMLTLVLSLAFVFAQVGQVAAAPQLQTQTSDNPISEILAEFFGVDPATIDGWHDDGFGFGVIAQALWITKNFATEDETIDVSALTFDVLQAKKDKDFATFLETFLKEHPEFADKFGDTLPTNWGQFKKALLQKHNNLGNVVSGHTPSDVDTSQPSQGNGQGNDNGHGNGQDHANGQGNGDGQGNGNGHGNGNNNGNGHGGGKNKP